MQDDHSPVNVKIHDISLTFPGLFVAPLPMSHSPAPNPKLCFHLLHQLHSHYCKCPLYKHTHNDVRSWLSALLACVLQMFTTSNRLQKEKVTVTAFLLARLCCQYITTHSWIVSKHFSVTPHIINNEFKKKYHFCNLKPVFNLDNATPDKSAYTPITYSRNNYNKN